jgi:glycosyltransferase involved in cell wall biosynthesis
MASHDQRIPVLMMAQELGWGGGIERDVSKFARHLSKYGIDAHVACFRRGGARWNEVESAGIPTVCIPVTSFKSPSVITAARQLKTYIAEHNIQVLHAFDAATDLFGVPVARLLGVPSLTSQLWNRYFLSRLSQLLLSVVDKIARGIFVNSHAAADELATNWHVPRNRIHVCQNGFEPKEFHPYGRKRPAQLAQASVVIGTVAVLREEKNIGLLLDAFLQVHSLDPRAMLLIVGDGPMKESLEDRAEELGLKDVCWFEEATLTPADWMRAIDVFVLCSRSESFPNALLEAMACGCCPVGSRVGGMSELITHEETGLMFDSGDVAQLADALCRLTRDQELRSGFAKAAAQFAHERLTIDVAAARLAGIYRQLLGRKPVRYEYSQDLSEISSAVGASS